MVIQRLLSKCEALSLNPGTTKKTKETKNKEGLRRLTNQLLCPVVEEQSRKSLILKLRLGRRKCTSRMVGVHPGPV
jgi:hypothetical protein